MIRNAGWGTGSFHILKNHCGGTGSPRGLGLVSFEVVSDVVFSRHHAIVRRTMCVYYGDFFQKWRICNCHSEGLPHVVQFVVVY